MDTVLIVDDNVESVENLKEGLQKLNQFQVVTAYDGQQAKEILERERISLLVTDIKMPKMDGLELLAYMTKNHTATPCIVMTGYGTPEMRRLIDARGVLQYIEKPFDFRKLALAIIQGLHLLDEGASMKGMSLRNFLPLVELAKKSCRLEVTSAGKGKGYFYFDQGELREAHYQTKRGDQAALEMLSWETMEIRFNDLPQGRARGRITKNLSGLLGDRGSAPANRNAAKAADAALPQSAAVAFTVEPDQGAVPPGGVQKALSPAAARIPTPGPVGGSATRRAFEKALAGNLKPLKLTKGYQAVAILNFVGDVMAADTLHDDLPLQEWGARFTDLFRTAHETAVEEGIGECRELALHGAEQVILVCSSGLSAKVRFYLIGVVAPEGNWYYMKLQLSEAAARIAAELA
ncbi:MAG: response regulator [Desulfobacterales bacterium]|jgi:CheY-like chemotaxis protein